MRILLTGASGNLGTYLLDRLAADGREVVAWSGSAASRRGGIDLRPIDLADAPGLAHALDEADPGAVFHLAAISTADGVRRDPDRARAVNVAATAQIAAWCARHGRRLLYTSTDLVFDGSKPWNREDDPAEPVLAYGRTKRGAEAAVLACPGGLVARVSLLYGFARNGRPAFFDRTIAALRRGEPQALFEDEFRTPLDLATAADALARLLDSSAAGLVHLGGAERMSRHQLIARSAAALGLDRSLVRANRQADAASPEPRPADVSLDTSRLASLLPDLRRPTIEEALSPPDR
jgi:dTDP-4-dehydrorhamnose reductase